jgi:hypothetical protein
MDDATAQAVEEKQRKLMMKRQVIAADTILKDFNWVLNMPLDQSQVVKSGNAILDHAVAREQTAM